MSDKTIFSKMDLLLIKAELAILLMPICDNILSLFPIIPLLPLTGNRSNFSSQVCFACDEGSPCPYLYMPLAFCHILSPHPVEDRSNRVTWWPAEVNPASDSCLLAWHYLDGSDLLPKPGPGESHSSWSTMHVQHFFPYRFA